MNFNDENTANSAAHPDNVIESSDEEELYFGDNNNNTSINEDLPANHEFDDIIDEEIPPFEVDDAVVSSFWSRITVVPILPASNFFLFVGTALYCEQ